MATYDGYRPYGRTTASLTVTESPVGAGGENVLTIAAGASFDVYDSPSNGNQVTDLLDDSGASISEVVTGDDAVLARFHAPDSVAEVWLDGGGDGERVQALPTDAYGRDAVDAMLADKADLGVDGIQAQLASITINEGDTPPSTGIWLVRPTP